MSGYIGPIPVPQGIQNKESFTATAAQTTFNTNGYTDGAFISVYLNGVRLVNGTDYTATNGSDVVLASASNTGDVLDFETFNSFSLVDQTFDNVTLKNPTHEDTDGGRESAVSFKGEQSGGEISTLAAIQASHDGTADDQKGDLIFKTNDGSDNNAPTERLRIDSTGNVGVSGSTKTTALSSAAHFDTLGLSVDDNTAYDNVGVGGGIAFRGKRNSSGVQTVFGAIDVGKESAANDSYVGSLRFYTNNNSTGIPTEHMRIDSGGKVRVGGNTATMSNSLTVEGASYTLFGMKRNTGVTTGTGEFAMHMETNSQTTISYDDEGSIVFGTAGTPTTAAGFSEKMRLNSSGQVLIGTASWVDSGTKSGLSVKGGGGGPYVLLVRNDDTGGGANLVKFSDGSDDIIGTIVGNATSNTVTYGTSSDYRLKENVTDVSNAISTLKTLKPKTYNFISDPDDTPEDGFLAHELATVIPSAVTGEKDAMTEEVLYDEDVLYSESDEIPEGQEVGDVRFRAGDVKLPSRINPQQVDYGKLTPILTAALQEAIAKIETLESENTAIKARLDALEAE